MPYMSKQETQSQGVVPIASNLFGTCATAKATAAKVVALADFDVLVSGVTVHVYFTYGNNQSNTTLKVGSTAATAVRRNGSATAVWEAGSVISFTYNGSYWIQNDADVGVTYTLGKSGNYIHLYGSDGSDTSAYVEPNTDTNTCYASYSNGVVSVSTTGSNQTVFAIERNSSGKITVPANGHVRDRFSVYKAGYLPKGVVGFNLTNYGSGTGVSNCFPWAVEIDQSYNNYVWYQISNISNTAHDIMLYATVLYVPY